MPAPSSSRIPSSGPEPSSARLAKLSNGVPRKQLGSNRPAIDEPTTTLERGGSIDQVCKRIRFAWKFDSASSARGSHGRTKAHAATPRSADTTITSAWR